MATPKQLLTNINAGKFKSLYYFFGSEDYRITEAVKFVSHKFLPDMQFTTNYKKIDGKKTKLADLINELAVIPMLGEKQVFVITEFQSFRPKEIQKVLSVLKPVDPNRIVLLTSPSARAPRKNSAFYKTMSSEAVVVEFNKLSVEESRQQISGKLKRANLTISVGALTFLVELLGGNRGAMESEIEKIINYKSEGEQVELEDVEKLTNGYEVFSVFELAELIVSGNTPKVLKMLRTLIAEGSSPVMLIALLQAHFISLYLVKNGKSPLGNRGFLIPRFKGQAAKYSNEQLEKIIIDTAKADSDFRNTTKTGMDQAMVLEILTLQLTGTGNSSHKSYR
ncbi:MAG: DNA polymerase III subunit delta [Calditrichaeota bacterium]|nr:MAG: DNA polymerase III subunit delta [Calditrichota bacterium]